MNREEDLKKKEILYIVHNYNSFQKDHIEEASKYFKNVNVLVRYKPISTIAKYLPFKIFKKFDDAYVIDEKDIPSNVQILRTPFWYLPYGFLNRCLGRKHLKAVRKIIKKYDIKFDLIHSHFVWSSGYVGMKLKEKYNVPLVITGHGYDVYKLPFSSDSWRGKIVEILESADRVITVSKYNEQYLKELGTDLSKVSIINNGFSPSLFYPQKKEEVRKRLDIDLTKKVCVSVGNLEKIKGQDILIEAIKILTEKGEEIFCYIVGNGSRYKYLQSLINSYGLEKNVFLLGTKPHFEIKEYISMSDVFVIPSRRESASVVLLEALACGKPVVATNVGIVPEVLENDKYGYIVDIENPKDLANAISKAISKKWDTQEIAKYSKQYTWEESVKSVVKIYNSLVK
jgi:glycosyltransferase involved in cell wall biosynthesis